MNLFLDENISIFQPFDTVSGFVDFGAMTQPAELRLFWYTKGRGTSDVGIIDRVKFSEGGGKPKFSFKLPAQPYSASGKLLSVIWSLELIDDQFNPLAQLTITVSPTGEELKLEPVDDPQSEEKTARKARKMMDKFHAKK